MDAIFNPFLTVFFRDEEEAAKLLIENGADVNARSKRGLTPLNLSAIKGHTSTLKVLIGSPNIDLSAAVRHWREGGREGGKKLWL